MSKPTLSVNFLQSLLAVLLGISAWLGFRAGAVRPTGTPVAAVGAVAPAAGALQHQWAAYEVAYDARQRGYQVRSVH